MNMATLNVKTVAKERDTKGKQQSEVFVDKTLLSRIFRL